MFPLTRPSSRSKSRQYTDHCFLLAINPAANDPRQHVASPVLARPATALKTGEGLGYNASVVRRNP